MAETNPYAKLMSLSLRLSVDAEIFNKSARKIYEGRENPDIKQLKNDTKRLLDLATDLVEFTNELK